MHNIYRSILNINLFIIQVKSPIGFTMQIFNRYTLATVDPPKSGLLYIVLNYSVQIVQLQIILIF